MSTQTISMSARSSFGHPLLSQLRQIATDGEHGLEELHDTVLMSLIDVSALLYGTDAHMLPAEWGFTPDDDQRPNSGVPFGADDLCVIEQCLLSPGVSTLDLLFVGNVLNRYLDLISEVY